MFKAFYKWLVTSTLSAVWSRTPAEGEKTGSELRLICFSGVTIMSTKKFAEQVDTNLKLVEDVSPVEG